MTASSPAFWVRINGIGHAFSREIGCACDRCKTVNYCMQAPSPSLGPFAGWPDPPWRAHTSASILIPNTRKRRGVRQHILVDVGAGVVDSLVASRLPGIHELAALLVTHWHPDHVLGLNQLCETLRQVYGSGFVKLPLYCTLATYDYLRDRFSYEVRTALRFQEIVPGSTFEVVPEVTVTPIAVAHRSIEGSVVYVLRIRNHTVITAWDIDMPESKVSGIANIDVFRQDVPKSAELLLMPANTWRAEDTGHTSFLKACTYIEAIRPKTVGFVHLSGHEDIRTDEKEGYGWTDQTWVDRVREFAAKQQWFPGVLPTFQGTVIPIPIPVSATSPAHAS